MRLRRPRPDSAEVPMSPLIDAVFLLLIFFLVVTMLKKQDKDIDITPPQSAAAIKLPFEDEMTVIGIDQQGRVFWDGVESTRGQMRQRLRGLAQTAPEQRVRVDADADTAIVNVVELLDACQLYGLSNVGIRTYDEYYNR